MGKAHSGHWRGDWRYQNLSGESSRDAISLFIITPQLSTLLGIQESQVSQDVCARARVCVCMWGGAGGSGGTYNKCHIFPFQTAEVE